jgi:hypothetical protein
MEQRIQVVSDYKPIYDHSFALIIGIDSYSDPRFPTLGNAASDAKSIADLLASPPFNFTVTTLFNEQASGWVPSCPQGL